MTTTYYFQAVYTKGGVNTHPSDVPTINVLTIATGALLVSAANVTKQPNMAGVCTYSYTGADNLNLIGMIYSTDITMDKQSLPCYGVVSLRGLMVSDVASSLAVSATQAATASSGAVAIVASYTFRQTVTSTRLEDLSLAPKLWWAVKSSKTDTDANSYIYVEKTGGLTVVKQAAYPGSVGGAAITDGSITVTGSSGAWSIALYLNSLATSQLFGVNRTDFTSAVKAELPTTGDEVFIWESSKDTSTAELSSITDGIVRAVG